MKEEKITIVKAKAINPKDKKNKEQSISFNMKDNTNQNSKITKLQENNINGNYGRIYIQEGQQKNLVYSEFDVPKSTNTNLLRNNENQTKKYNKVNQPKNVSNTRYSNSIDRNAVNKNRGGGRDNNNRESRLRRKSIDRGGDYKNIQITHIIDSALDIDFHITEPLIIVTEEIKKKYRGTINKTNRDGKNGDVKVKCTCSCDNVKIKPKEKKKNVGKVQVLTHRENPHIKRININKVNTKNNNSGNSYSMISKQKNNRPINKNEKK